MRVAVYNNYYPSTSASAPAAVEPPSGGKVPGHIPIARDAEIQDVEYLNMANGWIIASLGWLIWAFIAGLNVYLIVMLCMGKG